MPEAPEIKQFADELLDFFKNKKLIQIKILAGRYSRHGSPDYLEETNKLFPLSIKDINTKGKFIYATLDNNYILAFTMGLSGFFTTDNIKHNNIEFKTDKGSIYMNDVRNFGTFNIFKTNDQLNKKLEKLGPDIFDVSENDFISIVKSMPNKKIADFLMMQEKISGIGNYLRAEILWLSKINPLRKIKDLKDTEIKTIYNNSVKLVWYFYDFDKALKKKIISDNDKFPLDYNRDFFAYGEKKDIYNNEIITETLNNRTIHYAPNYQK